MSSGVCLSRPWSKSSSGCFPVRNLEETLEKRYKKALPGGGAIRLASGHACHLYHTISGLTLHRYHRLCQQFDVPVEQKVVIGKMVEAVKTQFDPEFFKFIEDPLPLEETLNTRCSRPSMKARAAAGRRRLSRNSTEI